MSTGDITIIALAVAVVVFMTLIILYIKKILSKETVDEIADIAEKLPASMGDGLFGLIYQYSRTAVLAVEQLVKNGKINPDDETRKDKAMALVEKAAKADDIALDADNKEVASMCIEACVNQLPHTKTEEA